jgi:hypothetical protein
MSGCDTELDCLRESVSCAVVLENVSSPWKLDRTKSTRDSTQVPPRQGRNHNCQPRWPRGGGTHVAPPRATSLP